MYSDCLEIFSSDKQKAEGILDVFPSIFVRSGGKRSSKMNAGEFLEVPLIKLK